MKNVKEEFNNSAFISRRDVFTIFGSFAAAILVNFAANDSARANEPPYKCVTTPQLTEGPFFIDERLNRSNVVDDEPGLPLNLNISIVNARSCVPLADVQIDI